ncbi:helix-turn-helix transcriptional regulator [Nocardiopsis halophila]|uniref:helix-turn-helix transcriptional regulator n=1 Tax=Nocardiopsis halophila TaxID=141692 RepID=UPI000369BBAD|nr:helix-turn-helix transcriptional regulator [Nocardiopsis halophila]
MENREERVDERLAQLEERVGRLERDRNDAGDQRPEPAAERPGEGTGGPEGADVFWALNRIKRMADPERGAVLFTGQVPLPTGERYEWQEAAEAAELIEADWSEVAGAIEALGHPVRLTLLQRVLTGTADTAALKQDPSLGTTGQLYHHLRRLTADGWLRSAGRGRYRVPPERIVPLLVVLMAARR